MMHLALVVVCLGKFWSKLRALQRRTESSSLQSALTMTLRSTGWLLGKVFVLPILAVPVALAVSNPFRVRPTGSCSLVHRGCCPFGRGEVVGIAIMVVCLCQCFSVCVFLFVFQIIPGRSCSMPSGPLDNYNLRFSWLRRSRGRTSKLVFESDSFRCPQEDNRMHGGAAAPA